MNHTPKHTHILSICAVVALGALASCGIVANHISSEAARELAEEVRDDIVDGAANAQQSHASYVVLSSALHRVIDREQAAPYADASFAPRFTGLSDTDHDGIDDDGHVEIVVRHATACIVAGAHLVTVHDGPC